MAWSKEQQAWQGQISEPERKEKCLALLHMAYMITRWTKDTTGQEHLKEHVKKVYGLELGF
ncbi:MAG: hypothetical protein HFI40_06440 [Lachnospiraceae bacterium]|jgi:hypothetical protein|nr:hypothetical protein [Lachnospiraceae bacterium]